MRSANRHSVSVAGAVLGGAGRILAIRRRDNGHWEPPGGVLESGEVLHDGLRREVLEETGLEVEPEALTGVYQNIPRDIVAFVFRCHVVGGQLRTSIEASEVAWLTACEITDRMDEAYAVRLLDGLAPSGQPHLRHHDGIRLLPISDSPVTG